jgi:hypothetical protein
MERGEGFEGGAEWKAPTAEDVESKRVAIDEVLASNEDFGDLELNKPSSSWAEISGPYAGHDIKIERKSTSSDREPYTKSWKRFPGANCTCSPVVP